MALNYGVLIVATSMSIDSRNRNASILAHWSTQQTRDCWRLSLKCEHARGEEWKQYLNELQNEYLGFRSFRCLYYITGAG